MTPQCILFDLDGTLADTAPDLGGALNRVLQEEGRPPLPADTTRPIISHGVRGLLRVGFGLTPDDNAYAALAERLLAHYTANICAETRLFDGMDALLATLERDGIHWGIVTNKPTRFTDPLVAALGLTQRAACIVSGDTTARPKPWPDPLLHACTLAAVSPARTLYVGDDIRDIQAGHAAGMPAIAAAWGYLGTDDPIHTWGADAIADTPHTFLSALALLPV